MTTPPPSENRSSVSAVVFGIQKTEIISDKLHHVANRNLMIILLLDIQLTTKYDQLCVCVWGVPSAISLSIAVIHYLDWNKGIFCAIHYLSGSFCCSCGIAIIWIQQGNSFPFHEPCKSDPPLKFCQFHQWLISFTFHVSPKDCLQRCISISLLCTLKGRGRKGRCHLSHGKNPSYFPWNTGCLIGIFILVYCNPILLGRMISPI